MRKTSRLPKRVKGSARANTPRTRSIYHRGLSNRPNPNNIDKYSSPFSLTFSFSRSLRYSPNVISPTRIQKEKGRSRYEKRKGNTGVAPEILSLAHGLFLKKTVAVPARGIPPPVLFSADFREATVFDSTSAGGAAWRYAMRISNRRDATRRAARRSASCTYLPGTCTTLFTTRSYTPSLPHGAIVLKIKKCVTGSEGKKLREPGAVVALSGPGERYSPFFLPFLSSLILLTLSLSFRFSFPILSHPLAHPTEGANPCPVNVWTVNYLEDLSPR